MDNINEMLGTPVAKLKSSSIANIKNKPIKYNKHDINQFAKKIEMDLQNYNSDDESINSDTSNNKYKQIKKKSKCNNLLGSFTSNISKFKDYDIIIFTILFLILNTNQSITFINDNLKYIKNIDINYFNLIIRSLIFGIFLYIVKKLYK